MGINKASSIMHKRSVKESTNTPYNGWNVKKPKDFFIMALSDRTFNRSAEGKTRIFFNSATFADVRC